MVGMRNSTPISQFLALEISYHTHTSLHPLITNLSSPTDLCLNEFKQEENKCCLTFFIRRQDFISRQYWIAIVALREGESSRAVESGVLGLANQICLMHKTCFKINSTHRVMALFSLFNEISTFLEGETTATLAWAAFFVRGAFL